MDEKRNYFRVKNTGSIKAKIGKNDLYVIDLSPSGASIVADDIQLIKEGIVEILINHFSIKVNYNLLKKQGENTIITFAIDDQINSLLTALKNVRDATDTHEDFFIKSPRLIPQMETDEKQKFLAPKIETFTKLSSLYSIRLYQLIQQYIPAGFGIISLDDLRVTLGINELKTYSSYGTMKRKIIEPAKDEINKITDLTLTYSEVFQEKKAVAIKFTIMSLSLSQ